MYRLYAQKQQGGWDKVAIKPNYEKTIKLLDKLKNDGYYAYMIIKNEGNGDEIVERNKLQDDEILEHEGKKYKKCKVERTNDFKSKYEVKGITFTPSRMKQKEELRRLTEDYLYKNNSGGREDGDERE